MIGQLHFTPTSSFWLNQVERWFGLLTDKQIRRGVHKNVQTPERDIRNWIKTWNEEPKPFVWTKTADEMLDRLAGYLNRIPDSGHQYQCRVVRTCRRTRRRFRDRVSLLWSGEFGDRGRAGSEVPDAVPTLG
uniref:Putative transposase n=1 Tax=Streptomyces auratus AGR0001 TaxID=1160718 RepID=J1RS45_9ACTN